MLSSDEEPSSHMATLYPRVQSAKITIPYLYVYWGRPSSASERSGRELDMPCAPQALVLLCSAKLKGQIACNKPAIFLSSSVSTLDPTAGSKEDYHSPIKKVNFPPTPTPPQHAVFISTYFCFSVPFPLKSSLPSLHLFWFQLKSSLTHFAWVDCF